MKLTDIAAAKQLKVRIDIPDARSKFPKSEDCYLLIEGTDRPNEFFVQTFEQRNASQKDCAIGRTDSVTSDILRDMLLGPDQGGLHSFFELEKAESNWIEVQTYAFESMTDYQTDIILQIPKELSERYSEQKLREMFIWTGLGKDAVFCLNYRNAKRNRDEVRFLSKTAQLHANVTDRGIIVSSKFPTPLRQDAFSGLPVNMFLAPSVKFVVDTGASSETDRKISDTIREMAQPKGYIDRWSAYEELSVQLRKDEAAEFGKVPFFGFVRQNDIDQTIFEFQIDEKDRDAFSHDISLEVRAVSEDDENDRAVFVGTVSKIKNSSVITVIRSANALIDVPQTGVLSLSTFGDKVISERRKRAKDRIISKGSPIKYLGSLVENGTGVLADSWSTHKGITRELEKNFSKSRTLNEQQKKALETAINTPEIALIQGPPGTGKTTVIKAIQERFRELFEAEERIRQKADPEYVTHNPHILISSFQNDAVDNAVADPLPGDMPANRKGRRADIRDQNSKALAEWYQSLKEELERNMNNEALSRFCQERRRLSDQYFAYVKSGGRTEDAIQLIRDYIALGEECYPPETVSKASEYIRAYNKAQSVSGDDATSELRRLLESQRVRVESYADDGEEQVGKLIAFFRNHPTLTVEKIDLDALTDMFFSDEPETEVFQRFIAAVTHLQDQYGRAEQSVDLNDSDGIRQFLLQLADEYANGFLTASSDLSAKTTVILNDFLARLEQEYESVIIKYSLTTAATCQSALEWKEENNAIYDLVIIDEAARANPLDLLIPMSMGKKIVLVGDHKQLPPMLEPDVIKKLQENPEFRNIPDIEISLFERLFDMFFKPKDGYAKAVRLEQQYRMHPDICRFVSEAFYDNSLNSGNEEDERKLAEARRSPATVNQGKAMTFLSVPGEKGRESGSANHSRMRRIEVDAVRDELLYIMKNDPGKKVGIITFYSAQAVALNKERENVLDEEQNKLVEVGTVDAFQGKEYDYVILSAVRSNNYDDIQKSVGFLVKPNRLCVAFSRAKRQLVVCGDPETLQQIEYFAKFIAVCKEGKVGLYREY